MIPTLLTGGAERSVAYLVRFSDPVKFGHGSLRQEMELLVQRKGLADKVRFLGTRSDIPELLSQADMFVLSSDYEEKKKR